MAVIDKRISYQEEFIQNKSDRCVMIAGRQTGKTHALAKKAVTFIDDSVCVKSILLVSPTRPKSKELRRRVETFCGVMGVKRSWSENSKIIFQNGCAARFVSSSSWRRGKKYDAIFIDDVEMVKSKDLQTLQTLSDSIYATMTPGSIAVIREFSDWNAVIAKTKDNPLVKESVYELQDFTVFESLDSIDTFGHKLLIDTNGRDVKSVCLCCGEGMDGSFDSPERVAMFTAYIYGAFEQMDCR